MNIGFLDENDIFICRNIIYSNIKNNIRQILEQIVQYGIKLLNSGNAEILKKVEVFLINKNKKEPNINIISKTLKTLIILYFDIKNNNRIHLFDENNQKKILLNKKWLDYYNKEFEEIKTLFKNKDFNTKDIKVIVSEIEKKKLLEIDKKIETKNKSESEQLNSKMANNNQLKISISPPLTKIKLNNNKTIEIINKDFFLVNQETLSEIKSYFDEKIKEEILYSYNNNIKTDIILIEKNPQYTLLLGNIDDKNNIYNIKHIFDFSSYNSYREEKDIILKTDNLDNYMKEKTIFNENLKNMNISPIIKNGDIIGYYYNNLENKDYNSYKKYYDLLLKGKLSNSIDIYFNYQRIYEKLIRKEENPQPEKYYIINKGLLTEIKICNEFKSIYDIMDCQKSDSEWKQK